MSELILAACIALVAILSLCPLPRQSSNQMTQALRAKSEFEA